MTEVERQSKYTYHKMTETKLEPEQPIISTMVTRLQGTDTCYINYRVQVHVSWPQKLSRILQAKFSNVQIIFLGFIFPLYMFRELPDIVC